MNLRIIITLLFVAYSSLLIAQASWGYSIKFKLISKDNETISIEDLKNGKIKVFSVPFGAHSNNQLKFDSSTNSFFFSQHTIATSSILVFKTSNDTTILNIQTTDLDIDIVKLTGKNYSFSVSNNEEKFIKNDVKDEYWKLKYPFETYVENNDSLIIKDLNSLVEVEIK